MGKVSLDLDQASSLPGLAHHYLGLTPADPKSPVLVVTHVREPTPRSVPGGSERPTECAADPKRKQALRAQRSRPCPILRLLIARLTIAEQDHSLRVGKTRNGVLQDLFHKPLVPYSRGKGHHQPGCRIDHFGLPQLPTLTPCEAPALIGLQAGAGQLLDPLVVEAVGMLPEADC